MLLTEAEKQRRLKAAYAGEIHVPEKMHRATQALFWEYRHNCRWKERNITPIFNLSGRDKNDTLSMKQLYLQCASDYEAALVILGSWEHWKKLCATPWFPRHLEKWQAARAERLAYLGEEQLVAAAQKGNVAAAKFLYQNGITPTKAVSTEPVDTPRPSTDWAASALARLDEGEK